ncbi:hypothetical protein SAMN05216337_10616 [Bradyrhizobium brasilense]|uniref:Uncharacterized protein n=2 Tax=Bradyrhizobium brasilense TaxID=1419277 RepID=A0A1G7M318_9BRAD|nr:hypothetical protein SAMN05216337_10616 [Bradyrhizobium brasilense]
MAAAVDAAGAALGALGMLAFAVGFSTLILRSNIPAAFIGASLAWLTIAVLAWYVRRKMRSMRTVQQASGSANSRTR